VQVGGHYAVQGHLRSLIIIESSYATSYNTNLHLSRTVCQKSTRYWSNYSFWQVVPLSNEFILRSLCEYRHESHTAKARVFGLHFYHRQCGSVFNHWRNWLPKLPNSVE